MIRSTRRRSFSDSERRWLKVFRTLNEFQARLFAADKALDVGRGGVSRLSALTGLSRTTITKAVEEFKGGGKLASPGEGRVRRVGGLRRSKGWTLGYGMCWQRSWRKRPPGPMSQLRWTSNRPKDGRGVDSFRASRFVGDVARCLDDMGYSLQANRKSKEGPQHADRDAQFRYINRQVKALLRTDDPVISVDAKKRNSWGSLKWGSHVATERAASGGEHERFPQFGRGQGASLWGLRHRQNRLWSTWGHPRHGRVCGESIRRWWKLTAKELSGAGDYSSVPMLEEQRNQLRAWKLNLQQMVDEIQIPITVCHYPPEPASGTRSSTGCSRLSV